MVCSEFAREWFKRGQKEENGIYKFFCFFVAFNWLYNTEHCRYEYNRVKNYVSKAVFPWKEYNAYKLLKTGAFMEPVKDTRSGEVKDYIKNESNLTIKLFLQIYQVRCNLFHGSKSMYLERNKELVTDSCIILEDFLKRVFEDKGGKTDGR